METHIYKEIRVAEMHHVEELTKIICDRDIGILSVGTGSVNDPCRLAAARNGKKLCIFATAPSMDGFASYSSPIVANGFKYSYAAKSPEVIIGDTRILAAAPKALKSAGFGDMIAKYVGLADWKISALVSGEHYCERVAALTKAAVDRLVLMADKVTLEDEETAGEIFSSLLLTGLGMSFMKNSRPASGAEHVVAHLLECLELRDGKMPNLHGEDVGVATLLTLELYRDMVKNERVAVKRESLDWENIYNFYGAMADDVKKMNQPTTVADGVSPEILAARWQDIRRAVCDLPDAEICRDAMRRAGCKLTVDDIGKSQALIDDCIRYSPYMRRRLTLLRLRDMLGL